MAGLIVLPTYFNIGVIYDVTEDVKKLIVHEDELILDAKNVETIDILGLQLIVCIVKSVLKSGIKLKINNISPQLQKYLSYVSLPSDENLTITRNELSDLNY